MLWLGLAVFTWGSRRLHLAAGLLAVPGAIIAAAHVPGYWNPATVARIGGVSPEDLVWIMAAGGISW